MSLIYEVEMYEIAEEINYYFLSSNLETTTVFIQQKDIDEACNNIIVPMKSRLTYNHGYQRNCFYIIKKLKSYMPDEVYKLRVRQGKIDKDIELLKISRYIRLRNFTGCGTSDELFWEYEGSKERFEMVLKENRNAYKEICKTKQEYNSKLIEFNFGKSGLSFVVNKERQIFLWKSIRTISSERDKLIFELVDFDKIIYISTESNIKDFMEQYSNFILNNEII